MACCTAGGGGGKSGSAGGEGGGEGGAELSELPRSVRFLDPAVEGVILTLLDLAAGLEEEATLGIEPKRNGSSEILRSRSRSAFSRLASAFSRSASSIFSKVRKEPLAAVLSCSGTLTRGAKTRVNRRSITAAQMKKQRR